MIWPTEIVCHRVDPRYTDLAIEWRPPEMIPPARSMGHEDHPLPEGVKYNSPYAYPFRTCSYCGSIHPEDLYTLVNEPPRPGVCDRCEAEKRPAPTDDPQKMHTWRMAQFQRHTCRVTLTGSDWKYGWPHKFYVEGIKNPIAGELVVSGFSSGPGDRFEWEAPGPAPFATHAKWYNQHLYDITDPETFLAFREMLKREAGIEFIMEGETLRYRAPHAGYQR